MSTEAGLIALAGRVMLGFYFAVIAGFGSHIRQSKMLEGFAQSVGFPLAAIAGWPTGLWLVAGGTSVALGIWPDVGSLMIIAFLIPAAAYFHRFWEIEDPMQKQAMTLLFWRNFFAVGALLVFFGIFVTLGPALRFAITDALFEF